jgi:hypothetical protein
MRRRSAIFGALMIAALAIPVGSAGGAPNRAHPSTKAFCTTMNHFLGFMRSAPRPSSLRRPSGRKLMEDLRGTAPAAVAVSAKTLTHSLEYIAKHGKHSLSKRANQAANASLLTTARYVVNHCADSRETRAYARLISGATAGVAVKATESSLRNALTNAKGLYVDTDSYLGATVAAIQDAEPSLDFTDGPTNAASTRSVSVHVVDASQIVMAAGTGTTCFFIRDVAFGPDAGTEFALAAGSTCDAAAAPTSWSTSWG